MNYELYYWPSIQGRSEFVRLALEEAGAHYRDVARLSGKDGGVPALLRMMEGRTTAQPPFAPPFLQAGKLIIGQTANILLYLGSRHRLAPKSDAGRLWVNQLHLTIADFLGEIHDTHHPLASSLYYEDQKKEARRRAQDFRRNRLPKFLGYFERILAGNARGHRHLAGSGLTYADLSMFQIMAGLEFAFPRAMARSRRKYRRLYALHGRVQDRARIAAYLDSARRIPFNNDGIFRHYAELDEG